MDLSGASNAKHASASSRQLDPSKGLEAWSGVKYLTDRERDEVDYQMKMVIKKCLDQIKELSQAERGMFTFYDHFIL